MADTPAQAQPDPSAPEPGPARRARRPAASRALAEPEPLLRKPVNTLAIVPKSHKITSLGRKSYNVLLHEAQEQGLDKTVFQAPLERIIRGVDFDSNDQALIKKHLRAMVSTTVEWQSPTTGEGSSWNVSGLLAHARLSKLRGQVWVEWSYAVNLKQELLEPTVFARLSLEIISQLRSHAGIALYEICARYKDIGRTSRQAWSWWRPVLSGRPETDKTARLEYRIFKRDTLKPAIAEVNAVTDLEIELVEHKAGRFIDELQFLIRRKPQANLPLRRPSEPVDLSLVARAQALGVDDSRAEELAEAYGEAALRSGLDALQRRLASAYPEPLRDPYRYLKTLMPGEATRAGQGAAAADTAPPSAAPRAPADAAAAPAAAPASADQQRRQAQWSAAWLRQRHAQVAASIAALSAAEQAGLCDALAEDMAARQVHPSIRKRLQGSGWQHPMVLHEMLRFYARGAIGDHWDQPTPAQLLAVAAQVGDKADKAGEGDPAGSTRFG
ncbi:MAG: replication initiation protein [Pseudomonadota bacterium]